MTDPSDKGGYYSVPNGVLKGIQNILDGNTATKEEISEVIKFRNNMNIDKITASYSDKRQIEQFEPVEMRVTLDASLEEGDDPDECYTELMETAKAAVGREMVQRIAEKRMEDDVDTDR